LGVIREFSWKARVRWRAWVGLVWAIASGPEMHRVPAGVQRLCVTEHLIVLLMLTVFADVLGDMVYAIASQ